MVMTVSCVSAAEYRDNSTAAVDEQVTLQIAMDDVQLEMNYDDADVLSAGSKDPNLNIIPRCNDYGDVSFWAGTEKNATGIVNAKFILLLPYGVEKIEVNENLTLKNGSVSWGGEGTFLPKGSYRVEATYYGDANYASAYKATPDTGPDAFNVPKYHVNLNFTNLAVNEKGNIVANGQLDNENADGPYNMLFTNNDTGEKTTVYRLFVKDKGIIEYEGAPELGGGEYIVSIRYIGTDQYFPTLSEEKYIGVSDIVIKKGKIELGVGDEIESGASLNPADAGNLTFASSNESVVTVDANTGVITAVGLGDATVTVSCAGNDKYGPAVNKTIAVSVKIPVNITVDPAEVALYIGENLTLNANLTPADAGNLTFVSSNPKVVNVTADGLIIAVGEGNADITVSFPGTEEYAASDVVVPVTVSLYDASVSAEDMELTIGENATIDYTTDPEGLNVTFVPDDSGVVNVTDDGLVTAIKQGTANITINVRDNKKYALNSTIITVTVSLYDASVSAEDMELTIGENGTIDYTTDPEGLNVTFVPDDSGVVEVNDNGLVTPIKEGTANITINVGDNETYALNSTVITVTVSKIPTEILIQNKTLDMVIDDVVDPVVSLMPSNAGNLSFKVSDDGVILVNGNGVVTAVGEGNATVTVSFIGNDKYLPSNATIAVTVSLRDVSVSVNNETVDLKVGDTFTIVPTTTPEGLNVTYLPDNSGVVSVDDKGVVTALKEGTASIIVKVGGDGVYAENSTTVAVTVSLRDVSVSVNNETVDLKVGDTFTIVPTTTPEGLNVTYLPDNSGVVSVDDKGVVTALKEGTAPIIVKVGGDGVYAENSTTVAVTVSKIPTEILIQNKTLDMVIDDVADPVVSLMPSNAGNLSFKVSDDGVILVNGNGVVTAVGEGNATVTVSFRGNDKYLPSNATIAVNVKLKDASVTADPDSLELFVGEEGKFYTDTTPEDLDIKLSSSNESVAIVRNVNRVPTVTAVGEGTAIITVTINEDKYVKNTTTVTVTVSKIPTEILIQNKTLDMKVEDVADPVVSLMPSNAGNLSFKVSDDSVILVNGKGVVTAVGQGTATVTVSFRGNDKYLPSNSTIAVTVSKIAFDPEITLNDTILTVEVPEDATGNATLLVGEETLVAPINDGVASFDLSDVPAGDYNATIIYGGNDKYAGFEVVYPILIETDFVLSAENLIKYFHGPERFVANLTDGKGKPIVNATVTININGVDYNRTTNDKGQASIAINLNSNEYPVVVTYNDTAVNATVTVLPTVNGTDITKMYRNGTQYWATFLDSEGNYLKEGETVRFNINGVVYDRKVTGDKGLAKLNINLGAGEYVITAINIVTGESTANNITVLSRIIENADLTKYYRNASQYTVKVLGDDGKPVGAGETVRFNINGVVYERQTNASGIAKMNINLQPGDYVITAEYQGSMVSNNIKVLPILNASDISMKYRDGTQFKATLVDGQGKPYSGQSVTFNINGVFYNRVTDSSGTAKLNINLMPGEYIITSSYNGSSIANTVKVTA